MELKVKFLPSLLQCTLKLRAKFFFFFNFAFTLLFLKNIFYSFCISFSFLRVSLLIASPSFLSSSIDPSPIYTNAAATDPSLSTHAWPPTWSISAFLLYFQRFGFVFQAVLVFRAGFLFQAWVSIWLCWFFCFIFLFFFTGFDGHSEVVVVQWFLWVWWWLWLCVGSWMKYYFIVLKAKIKPLL